MSSGERVKVCFCGPTPMAHDIHAAAGTIEGFDVQVSSENFNEGKRPTPTPASRDFRVAADTGLTPGLGIVDDAFDDFVSIDGALSHGNHGNRVGAELRDPVAVGEIESALELAAGGRVPAQAEAVQGQTAETLRFRRQAATTPTPLAAPVVQQESRPTGASANGMDGGGTVAEQGGRGAQDPQQQSGNWLDVFRIIARNRNSGK